MLPGSCFGVRWQTPKLPEVRHFLDDFRTGLGRTGRAGISFGRKGKVFCQKNLKPGLTPTGCSCYIIEEATEREGKVPFFMILIPLKLLLIILVIQHLLQ